MLACMNIQRYTQLQLTLLENEQSVTQFITTSLDSGSWKVDFKKRWLVYSLISIIKSI